jgi:type IV secretion system protein VirB10
MNPDVDSSQEAPGPDLSIRAPRGRVSGIRKRYVQLAIALLALVVTIALVVGLRIDFHPDLTPAQRPLEVPSEQNQPLPLADLPGSYGEVPQPKASADTQAMAGGSMPSHQHGMEEDSAKDKQIRRDMASMMAALQQLDTQNKKLLEQLHQRQNQNQKERAKVLASSLFFRMDQKEHSKPTEAPAQPAAASSRSTTGEAKAQNHPDQKLTFLKEPSGAQTFLDQPLLPPRSDYQLMAGTVIPAALLTGINTDLPGDVLAVVTEPVYDTRSGRYLLIPQGSRLQGRYDSQVGNGQNRALVVWDRLILPNDRSIQLQQMPATDGGGYAGLADHVDYHGDKLAAGVALSTLLAYGGNLARSRVHRRQCCRRHRRQHRPAGRPHRFQDHRPATTGAAHDHHPPRLAPARPGEQGHGAGAVCGLKPTLD